MESTLLFDEPFSNLNAKMRVSMCTDISKLHASLNATMIYVTHDQVESNDRIELVANIKKSHFFEMADKSKFRKDDRNEVDGEKWQAACKLIV